MLVKLMYARSALVPKLALTSSDQSLIHHKQYKLSIGTVSVWLLPAVLTVMVALKLLPLISTGEVTLAVIM